MSNYSNNQNSYKKIDGNFDGKKNNNLPKDYFSVGQSKNFH